MDSKGIWVILLFFKEFWWFRVSFGHFKDSKNILVILMLLLVFWSSLDVPYALYFLEIGLCISFTETNLLLKGVILM